MPLNLGNLGGSGSGPLTTPNVGSLIQAAQPPPIVQIMQGLAQLPTAFMKSQSDAMAIQSQHTAMEQQRMEMAGQQYDALITSMRNNPQLASSEFAKKRLEFLSKQLQIPFQLDDSGNIDPNTYKLPLSDYFKDKDLQDRAESSPPNSPIRRFVANTFVGIDKNFLTSGPTLTGQEEAKFAQIKSLDAHYVRSDKDKDEMTQSSVLLNKRRGGLYTAETQRAYDEALKARSDMVSNRIKADASMRTADAAVSRADTAAKALSQGIYGGTRSSPQITHAWQLYTHAINTVNTAEADFKGSVEQYKDYMLKHGDQVTWVDDGHGNKIPQLTGSEFETDTMANQLYNKMNSDRAKLDQDRQTLNEVKGFLPTQGDAHASVIKATTGKPDVKVHAAAAPSNAKYGSLDGRKVYYVPGDPHVYDAQTHQVVPGVNPP